MYFIRLASFVLHAFRCVENKGTFNHESDMNIYSDPAPSYHKYQLSAMNSLSQIIGRPGQRYLVILSLLFFIAFASNYRTGSSFLAMAAPTDFTRTVRIVAVSDTHNDIPRPDQIPDGDIFIHAGDMTDDGTYTELKAQYDWIAALPHEVKVVIGGIYFASCAK